VECHGETADSSLKQCEKNRLADFFPFGEKSKWISNCNSFDNTWDLGMWLLDLRNPAPQRIYWTAWTRVVLERGFFGISLALKKDNETCKLTNLRTCTRLRPRCTELHTDPSNHSWCLWPRSLSRITKDQGLISERKHESLLSLPRKAAGTEIIQYQFDEIVTRCIRIGDIIPLYLEWEQFKTINE